jgi:hypothetical protein
MLLLIILSASKHFLKASMDALAVQSEADLDGKMHTAFTG